MEEGAETGARGSEVLGRRMRRRADCWSGAGSGVRLLEFPKVKVPRPLPPGGGSLWEAPPAFPIPRRAPDVTPPLRPPTLFLRPVRGAELGVAVGRCPGPPGW